MYIWTWLKNKLTENENKIGNLATLNTINKANLVNALNELKAKIDSIN